MTTDPWLERWLPLVEERVGALPVLELGCGSGRDTQVLVDAGIRVVAIDLSAPALALARIRVPSSEFHCQDIRDPFPPSALRVNVVVASLSLHYFAWDETFTLVHRIRETLTPRGLLLCRLNSTNDHHYGASGHEQIDTNYYLVDGMRKRFFDRAAVDALFAEGWNVRFAEERVVQRYTQPKALWEIVLEKALR